MNVTTVSRNLNKHRVEGLIIKQKQLDSHSPSEYIRNKYIEDFGLKSFKDYKQEQDNSENIVEDYMRSSDSIHSNSRTDLSNLTVEWTEKDFNEANTYFRDQEYVEKLFQL